MTETAEQFKEHFRKWAAMVGDHRATDALDRYETYRAYMKERENEAIRQRAKDE